MAIFPLDCKKETDAIKAGSVSYIHFDAKYRIEDLTQFINSDKKVASESELENSEELLSEQEENEFEQEKSDSVINTYKRGDLLKMHTYNDAIRRTVGSYVLYPGKENNKNKNDISSVYDEILPGVGAFAIRPGNQNAGHEAIKEFIKKIISLKSNEASRKSRATYFENMVISSATQGKPAVPAQNGNLCMLGFLRYDYYNWLKNKHFIPLADAPLFSEPDGGIYFYYYAIRDGAVYPLHKDVSKATKFCASITDFGKESDIGRMEFLPFVADIVSTELVSKDVLSEKLKSMNNGNGYEPTRNFNAQFYYLIKLKNIQNMEITGNMIKEIDSGNQAISPYSPKIFKFNEK